MSTFESFQLNNGLKVILQEDILTPLVAVNLIYKVGSAYEQSNRTGLAHFLEHLMFTGTQKFPNYDDPLQYAGGDSNAYTSTDVTSYNAQLPAENLKIILQLEADRMSGLSIKKEAYNTQMNVILEEYKEQYLMKPYGDLWKTVKEQLYGVNHPYRWMTIGDSLEAIKHITQEDLQSFYELFYVPNNACLAIVGNRPILEMKKWVIECFDPIPASHLLNPPPLFPTIRQPLHGSPIILKGEVPETVVLWTSYMPAMFTKAYYCAEFWLYFMNSQENSPLYDYLVNDLEVATDVYAYHSDSLEQGIIALEIRGLSTIEVDDFSEKLNIKILEIIKNGIPRSTQAAILNKIKTSLLFEELSAEYKAHKMAYLGLLNQENFIENELKMYADVTEEELIEWTEELMLQGSQQFYYFPQ